MDLTPAYSGVWRIFEMPHSCEDISCVNLWNVISSGQHLILSPS